MENCCKLPVTDTKMEKLIASLFAGVSQESNTSLNAVARVVTFVPKLSANMHRNVCPESLKLLPLIRKLVGLSEVPATGYKPPSGAVRRIISLK